jgi:hypothetical protein
MMIFTPSLRKLTRGLNVVLAAGLRDNRTGLRLGLVMVTAIAHDGSTPTSLSQKSPFFHRVIPYPVTAKCLSEKGANNRLSQSLASIAVEKRTRKFVQSKANARVDSFSQPFRLMGGRQFFRLRFQAVKCRLIK